MNKQSLSIALAILVFIFGVPLAAQNSPAGGLASGNVINRDVDTYMMVNFAPFLNYDKFFTFVQGTYAAAPGTLMSAYSLSPGFSAGYATKASGAFMHFYLNTTGFSLNDATETADYGTLTREETKSTGKFNMQFDTILGTADIGAFKLGLLFSDIGQQEGTFTDTSTTDFKKEITKTGFFTPSLAYGKNFINDDFSMLLAGGTARVRIPMDWGRTITEENTGGVTTTTTEAAAKELGWKYPNGISNASVRMEIEPQMWYFFKPKLDPMVVISHIYLLNTFIIMFYPEELSTIQASGLPDGYVRRKHDYVGDTFLGYYNAQYVISSRLSLAWRLNFSAGFFYSKKDHTFSKDPGGTETVKKETEEVLFLTATVAPRLAFAYQLIPATLSLNGAVVINALGPLTATGWQFYQRKTTNEDTDTVATYIENIFNPINPVFSLGAAWNLNPHLILESGVSVNTSRADNLLNEVSVGVVYKR